MVWPLIMVWRGLIIFHSKNQTWKESPGLGLSSGIWEHVGSTGCWENKFMPVQTNSSSCEKRRLNFALVTYQIETSPAPLVSHPTPNSYVLSVLVLLSFTYRTKAVASIQTSCSDLQESQEKWLLLPLSNGNRWDDRISVLNQTPLFPSTPELA